MFLFRLLSRCAIVTTATLELISVLLETKRASRDRARLRRKAQQNRVEDDMYKAIGIWTWPREEDITDFERHYETVHYPLALKLPGLERVTVMRAAEDAREAGIFRLAECYWADRAAFEDAAASAEWTAMAADAMQIMATYGVELKAAHGVELGE